MKEIISRRFQSHFQGGDIADVIQQLGCIQAQDTHQAPRVVASRCNSSIDYNDLLQAITNKQLVRTWPMRGTLHYVDPRYVRIFLKHCASKTLSGFKKRREFLGISDQQAQETLILLEQTLKQEKILTRSQVKTLLTDANLCDDGQRVYHLTCYAGTLGIICFGPPEGKEDTFVLLDEWIPNTREYTKEESLTQIARMYFTGHGPATIDDLCWRTGLSKTESKLGINLLGQELEIQEVNGKHYYTIKGSTRSRSTTPPSLQLLGGFDEYFLGYKERSMVADIEHHSSLFSKNGIFFPLIIKDGKAIGTRKREFKKEKVRFTISPLPNHTIILQDIAEEAKKYSRFWGYDDYEITLSH